MWGLISKIVNNILALTILAIFNNLDCISQSYFSGAVRYSEEIVERGDRDIINHLQEEYPWIKIFTLEMFLVWHIILQSLSDFVDLYATIEEGEGRNALELVKSVSDKHLDLLRPSARYYSMFKGYGVLGHIVDRNPSSDFLALVLLLASMWSC
ncbi:hypothetical protein PHJA_002804100 [Phtheirospermum japonicum]|uniref:Uncharacterized protein n=1 Tax=Phtheirospermum japonicum TaxID=374723 RepID=A0A830D3H8_9LAMI|nr:hypothetical protein PHJA_002804100 [Phtheirospermum japonicum]